MTGGIYSDQRCVVCGGHLRDTGKDLSCPDHPAARASRFKVKFGKIIKRFKAYDTANRFLNGVRFKTDERTFDARDYQRNNPLSFTNVSEKWKEMKQPKVRKTSFQSMTNHLEKAQAYFGHMNVKEIRYSHLEDFLATLTIGEKTKHNVMATLHSMFVWMKKRQDIHEVPDFPEVRFDLGYRKTVDKEIQQSIIDDLRQHEPFKVWLGVRFLATYISIRPMELMNITYANVDLKNGYLYIPHPKEKKYKAVPILAEDVALLSAIPRKMPGMYIFGEEKRYGENRFYKAWKRACSRLGIEGVDLYGGTRHSSARALRKFFSPEEIKRATMHSSNAAFERYFVMESDDVRSIYKRAAEVIKIDTALTPENRGTGVLKNAASS
jgi:integrase